MSLINEVLRKLDQKPAVADSSGMYLPPNLRPDQVRHTPRLIRWGLIITVAIVAGAGVGAGALWFFMGGGYFAPETVAEKPAEDGKEGKGDKTGVSQKGAPKKGAPQEEANREPPRPLLLLTALWDWPDAPPLPGARQSARSNPKDAAPETVSAGSEMTKLRVAPPRHQHPRVSKVFTYPRGQRWPVADGEGRPADSKPAAAGSAETGQESDSKAPASQASNQANQDAAAEAGPRKEPTPDSGQAEQAGQVKAGEDKVEVQLHPQTRRRREGEQLASRGYGALQAGRLGEAVSLLRAARERLPGRSGVANNLALALWKQDQTAEAIRVLNDSLQQDITSERMARNLGHFLLSAPQAGPREAARKALAEAAVKQGTVAVYILAGRVLHQDGRPDQAAELLQLGEQRLGGPWRLAYERGQALVAAGRADDASKAFQKALASLPPGADEPRQRVRSALERLKGRD